jgi:hypothetical protein
MSGLAWRSIAVFLAGMVVALASLYALPIARADDGHPRVSQVLVHIECGGPVSIAIFEADGAQPVATLTAPTSGTYYVDGLSGPIRRLQLRTTLGRRQMDELQVGPGNAFVVPKELCPMSAGGGLPILLGH